MTRMMDERHGIESQAQYTSGERVAVANEHTNGATGAMSDARADRVRPQAPRLHAPILLAIDTCTHRSSIALRDASTLRAECSWESDRHHTAAVTAQVRSLLQSSDIAPEQIGAVAVAVGPGSFTGVRCGLAIAKGMSVARDLPLIGVSAFDIIAAAQPRVDMPLYALVEAGRARVAACRYDWQDDKPCVSDAWRIQSWQQFAESLDGAAWVCGDLSPTLATLLDSRTRVSAGVSMAPAPLNLRRAGYLAEIGYARWLNAETDDPMTLMPIYPVED